jgi:pimeloyl-ACP methyl ester carboxylesterase
MNKAKLLLHEALGSRTQLEPLKNILSERNQRVYSLNFSGHGGELFSKDGFGIDVFAQDVIRFLDEEKIEIIDIIGYSMGGYVASWLAHQYPSRVGSLITLGTKFDWTPESAQREIKKMDPEKIQVKLPAFACLLEHRHAPNDWKELMQRTTEMMFELGEQPLLTEKSISIINHPAKILLGDLDDMADRNYSEAVAAWLPHGEFHLLINTPHPIEKVNLQKLLQFVD